jgi:myo-inositol 2-dehydrogenase/D-chiro-inositol 1-dehydrogenase
MAVRVALVGAGGMGRHHAMLITAHPDARVVAVSDANHGAATDVAQAVGADVAAHGLEAITASDVDAVVIASPDATHSEYAVAALEAAKPVLCEKPLGDTVAQARATLDTEVQGGRRLPNSA